MTFFNFIGKLIHSEGFRNFVTFAVGIFYQIGGVWLIKKIAELGTIAAVFVRKHPILSSYIPGLNVVADMDDDGIYHMRPDCLQQYAHYTTCYDDVFRAAVNKASDGEITVDVHQSQIFWVDLDGDKSKDEGEEFIIWSWKGDYMNLGAGAETGIYQVKDGEMLSSDCEEKLEAAGFKKSTIKKAKKNTGVISRKKGFLWYWSLPMGDIPRE